MAEGKGVVVAGCVPQGDRGLVACRAAPPLLDGVSSIGVKQLGRVGEAAAASLRRSSTRWARGPTAAELPKQRKASRDRSFIHGVSGRVHLLQDAARAGQARLLRAGGHRSISQALDEGCRGLALVRTRAPTVLIYKRLYQPCYCD